MRTVTRNIQANKGDSSFPFPKDWRGLLSLKINDQTIAYAVEETGTGKVIELSDPMAEDGVVTAHVILKDLVDK
jgi:hypothetical protein